MAESRAAALSDDEWQAKFLLLIEGVRSHLCCHGCLSNVHIRRSVCKYDVCEYVCTDIYIYNAFSRCTLVDGRRVVIVRRPTTFVARKEGE